MLIYASDVTTGIKLLYLAPGLKSLTTMYCSVYGCSSSSKKNTDGQLHFFLFPNAKNGPEDKSRAKAWTEFCKRKGFRPSKNACICSLHFDSNSYLPLQSPDFLRSINFTGKRKVKLKDDALPTLNTPLNGTREQTDTIKIRALGALSRLKVSTVVHNITKCKQIIYYIKKFQISCIANPQVCKNVIHVSCEAAM